MSELLVMSELQIAESKISFECAKLPLDRNRTLESDKLELKVTRMGCSVFNGVYW